MLHHYTICQKFPLIEEHRGRPIENRSMHEDLGESDRENQLHQFFARRVYCTW